MFIRTFIIAVVLCMATLASGQEPASEKDPPRAFEGTQVLWPEFPDPEPDAPDARLRIVFDLVSKENVVGAEVGVPFEAFVIAYDVQVALRGWEAKIIVDPRLTVVGKDLLSDLNLGTGDEVRAALSKPGDCPSGSPIVLGTIKLMVLEEGLEDLVLGLAPVESPSYPTHETALELPTPVYLVCRPDADIRPFDYCKVCAVVNPEKVKPEQDEVVKRPSFAPASGRHD